MDKPVDEGCLGPPIIPSHSAVNGCKQPTFVRERHVCDVFQQEYGTLRQASDLPKKLQMTLGMITQKPRARLPTAPGGRAEASGARAEDTYKKIGDLPHPASDVLTH